MPRACSNLLVLILALSVCLGVRAHVHGQQEPAGSTDEAETSSPATEEESPLLREPETAADYFDAAVLMLKLARPGLTRRYLEGMMEQNPDDDVLLQLRDKHGPAVFLKLANIKSLRPLSTQLLDRVNRAFRQRGTDPKRIDVLLDELDESAHKREVALISLRAGGPGVVPQILKRLQQAREPEERDRLLFALTRLGPQVISPLLGGLSTPDDSLKSAIIEALGWVGDRNVVPWLWFPAFGADQPGGVKLAARTALSRILRVSVAEVERTAASSVAGELHRIALEHYRNEYEWPRPVDTEIPEGVVEQWTWSPEAETIVPVRLSPQEASLYAGARFARESLTFSPEKRDAQALYLGMALAVEAAAAGTDGELPAGPGTAHDLALTTGAELVGLSLQQALANQNPLVATAAVRVLGQVATRHQLTQESAAGAPLLTALNSPDIRIRFAAAEAVLQLDPVKPFRGSRRVVEILTRAIAGDGPPHSVVVDANVQRASRAAGFLAEMGFDPLLARTGRDGFRQAAAHGDVQIILLQANTIRWGLTQTVANLRADARTAGIPIAVYGDDSLRAAIDPLTRRYPMVHFVIETATVDALKQQLQPFLDSQKFPMPGNGLRTEYHARAVYWLAHIASGRRTEIFDIAPAENALQGVLTDDTVAQNAITALAAIPTATVQQQFEELAVNSQTSPELRITAALQLAFHIQRFGLLLEDRQVNEVRSSWEQADNPELATALAAVLGSLKPNASLVNGRLQQFPAPVLPAPATP